MISITSASLSNTSLGYSFTPTTRLQSTIRIKGAPRPVSDNPDAFYTLKDEFTGTWYTYRPAPYYLGQLCWSSAVGTPANYQILRRKAFLFVAVEDGSGGLKWVPCMFTGAASYLDPATGGVWDPMGRYTCNPPYLCAG